MKVYIEVTCDEYELPVKIADSLAELAEMCGANRRNIASAIAHYNSGINKGKYRRVEIEDDDEE